VLVRAVFLMLAVQISLVLLDLSTEMRAFTLWSSLLALATGSLVLARRRLLAVNGIGFAHAFGLTKLARPSDGSRSRWACSQSTSSARRRSRRRLRLGVHHVALVPSTPTRRRSGARPRWRSSTASTWSCGRRYLEELMWRGLLYLTLRRHYSPWRAALLSGAIFGALHLYSLPGLLSVTWSGLVWAFAFRAARAACGRASRAMRSTTRSPRRLRGRSIADQSGFPEILVRARRPRVNPWVTTRKFGGTSRGSLRDPRESVERAGPIR
jgi:hypothetical protein